MSYFKPMSADLVRLPRMHTNFIHMKLLLRTVTDSGPGDSVGIATG